MSPLLRHVQDITSFLYHVQPRRTLLIEFFTFQCRVWIHTTVAAPMEITERRSQGEFSMARRDKRPAPTAYAQRIVCRAVPMRVSAGKRW